MATEKVAQELQSAIDALTAERDELDEQISILQDTLNKLQGKRGGGRGRKKKVAKTTAKKAGTKKKATRKKPHWSPEAKKAAADRMKK